jgi:RNA polymerase sigma-70 factor (ECF subfamily)
VSHVFPSRAPAQHIDSTSGPPDEAEIIARSIADIGAFAPLYRHYLDPIHQYCYRRLGSREVAEDATSLVFERALKALPGYRGGIFRAWLFTIAHNVITDSYRSTRSHEPLDAADAVIDPALEPEALALLADEQRLLLTVLPMLPNDQRRVIELRLSGLPSTEVALILDRTPESVRTLQLRAIRRLRTLLDIPMTTREAHHA